MENESITVTFMQKHPEDILKMNDYANTWSFALTIKEIFSVTT